MNSPRDNIQREKGKGSEGREGEKEGEGKDAKKEERNPTDM